MKAPDVSAQIVAREWLSGLHYCCDKTLPQSKINLFHQFMHEAMLDEVVKRINSPKVLGKFFRELGKAFEQEFRTDARVRIWLKRKHEKKERFTRHELIDEAYNIYNITTKTGNPLEPKQLDRYMKRYGYKYRNSQGETL